MSKIMNLAHPQNPCNGRYGKCLDVKITNECNGECAFCIEKGGYSPTATSVGELISATMALTDYQTVLILGGEPLMYEHLPEYLEGIQGKKEIFLTTNGSLLNAKTAARIAPYLTAINISIHHYDEDRNAEVYGTWVSFVAIADAIEVFHNAGVRVRINTNLVRGLFRERADVSTMRLFARDLGADEIRFAELQYCADRFIQASHFFNSLPEDPFKQGCEMVLGEDGAIKTIIRLTCGLVNPCRKMPENPVCCGSQTKVLYPNGEVCDGWKTQRTRHETVGEILQDVWPTTCHTWLRTGGSPSCHQMRKDPDLERLVNASKRSTEPVGCHIFGR